MRMLNLTDYQQFMVGVISKRVDLWVIDFWKQTLKSWTRIFARNIMVKFLLIECSVHIIPIGPRARYLLENLKMVKNFNFILYFVIKGDSGGPLMGIYNNVKIQIGIVSFGGSICEDPKHPPVFVNLTNPVIKNFINKNRYSPSVDSSGEEKIEDPYRNCRWTLWCYVRWTYYYYYNYNYY